MAFVGSCGHVRDPDPSKPCLRCQQAEKEGEWEKNHPDKEKYLRETGWNFVYLEGGEFIGWYKKEAGAKIFNFFDAVEEQRRREKDQPLHRQEKY